MPHPGLVGKAILLLTVMLFALFATAKDLLSLVTVQAMGSAKGVCARQLWVGAYVPGWNQGDFSKHDYALDGITDYLHFAVYFRPGDGRLDLRINELSRARMKGLVSVAHKNGKQVLLVVGGEAAAPGLRIAASPRRLQQTVRSILSLVNHYDYDGIDVDWEPLPPQDADLYSRLILGLSNALEADGRHRGRRLALTTAIEVDLNDEEYMTSLVRTVHNLNGILDRIELMTYTMANPDKLPFVWHNAALYPSSTSTQPGLRTPNADDAVRTFLAAGIEPSKLGIGINLHGYLWSGSKTEDISIPGMRWKIPPTLTELSYGELMKKYFKPSRYRWDDDARVPYLIIPETNQFISYEDSRGIRAKLDYVQRNGLGGIFIWDIGQDDQDYTFKPQLLATINQGARFCPVD